MGYYQDLKRIVGTFAGVYQYPFHPPFNVAHESIPLDAAVRELGPPKGVSEVMIQALTQNIRYTLDGSNPTAARGFQMVASDPPIIIPYVAGRTVLRFIREAAGAILEVQYGE